MLGSLSHTDRPMAVAAAVRHSFSINYVNVTSDLIKNAKVHLDVAFGCETLLG